MQLSGHNTRAKIGGAVPTAHPIFFGGGAGSPFNTILPGPRSTSVPSGILIHPAVCPQQTWAKNWGLCPFWEEGAGSPSNAIWPGPRPTSMPSFILIHPTIWPQYTNVIDRQDRQTQWSDSIGQTVLQTVAQKFDHSIILLITL